MIVTRSNGRSYDSPFADDQEAARALFGLLQQKKLGHSDGFARSILGAFEQRRASPDQRAWIHILVLQHHGKDAPKATTTIPFDGVSLLFSVALRSLKAPRVRLDGMVVRVGYKGHIVAIRTADGARKFLGEVYDDGLLHVLDCATPAELDLLRAFAEEPLRLAKIYGDRTGNCCFCGLFLTTAESVGSGYGPICADKWGLPWSDSQGALRERAMRKAVRLKEQIDLLTKETLQ